MSYLLRTALRRHPFKPALCMSSCSTEAAEPKPIPPSEDPARKGQIAKRYPAYVLLEEGKKYVWCACGLSNKQPFCDSSHKKMEHPIKPIHFTVKETKKYLLCRCKQTNNRPFCDMTHVKTFIPESVRSKLKIKL
uniref:Putative secretory protein n=2 Tax=Ornithodoros turicata TaxID=34597 RepID=A0A2R5LH14_9ACAR